MKKLFILLISIVLSIVANAQDAKDVYKEGKDLYEAQKYKEAFAKFSSAAQQGNKKAQYYLGRCYDKGRGVAEDNAKAFEWYQKSASQDYHKAQYELGRCYKKGKGTTKDLVKAAEYFQKSATQGNAEAQYELGKCYLKGKGVTLNEAKASELINQAVSNPKDGADVLKKIKKDAADGDADAKKILKMIK